MRSVLRIFITKSRKKSGLIFTRFIDMCFPVIYKIHAKKFTSSVVEEISRSAYIVSPLETLKIIETFIEEKRMGAYMRFGDGDVYLALGKKDMLQASTKKLSEEMNYWNMLTLFLWVTKSLAP